jgi:hypothetical protein
LRTSAAALALTFAILAPLNSGSAQTSPAPPVETPPITSLKDLVVRTIQACRDEQQGKQLLYASARQLGYAGNLTYGLFKTVEDQSVKLQIEKQGCRISFIASPKPFGETIDALIAQSRTWTPPQQVLDQRKPLKQDDGDSLRTFVGWQSDDHKHAELLIVDEPDAGSKTPRAGYALAYARVEQ